MSDKNWKYDSALHANSSFFQKELSTNEQELLYEMVEKLGNRPFMLPNAQGFGQSAVVTAYETEKAKFLQNFKRFPRSSLPKNANVVSSHTAYRIVLEDEEPLLLKAQIAPHGNGDSDTENL